MDYFKNNLIVVNNVGDELYTVFLKKKVSHQKNLLKD